MLVRVLRRCLPDTAVLAAASLFALHPIQAEPVLYVFARATLLATLLCLASFVAWLREKRWLAAGWFALALAAKEECVGVSAGAPADARDGTAQRARAVAQSPGCWPSRSLPACACSPPARASDAPAGAQAGVSVLDYLRRRAGDFALCAAAGDTRRVHSGSGYRNPFCCRSAGSMGSACGRDSSRSPSGFAAARTLSGFLRDSSCLAPSSSIFPAQDLAADRRIVPAGGGLLGGLGFAPPRAWPRVVAGFAALLALLSFER
jgi:hypothetical protein